MLNFVIEEKILDILGCNETKEIKKSKWKNVFNKRFNFIYSMGILILSSLLSEG